MNERSLEAATGLVPKTYMIQGRDAKRTHEKHIQILLEQRKVPDEGWDDLRIELLLQELSLMDSNNFPENVGVGEREARVHSNLVAQRHFRFGHGIGRSGDITAVQPKAAGSSLLMQLTNSMVLDIIRQRGLEPVVVENILDGEELKTDVTAIEKLVHDLKPESVVCVLTTTSCFAPRAVDRLSEVSQLCKTHDIPHLVNNAYGVQSTKCMHSIQEAHRVGRVDAFVQSTDKNFMVPVGGSVVASSSSELIQRVSQIYPGRASATPSLDVFITLLSLGRKGYQSLCDQRKENFRYLKRKLEEVASKHGERVLTTPHNPISIAVSLSDLPNGCLSATEFGSMLFMKCVSGTRVVAPNTEKTLPPHTFTNWGAHFDGYPCPYFTAAAAIGMKQEEVDVFIKRLDKVFVKFSKRQTKGLPSEAIKKDQITD